MTTTVFLVRHGSHDRLDRILCGRMPGVGLSREGRAEAERVAERLQAERVGALYSSPLQRARETAEAIAARLGLEARLLDGLQEIDFGDWTGAALETLHADPRWGPWNRSRSLTRPPGGESMAEAQVRAVRAVEAVRARHPDEGVALVSHGDVIKALVCCWLGLDLDHYDRFDIDPGSLTTAVVGDWGVRILRVNEGVRP